VHPPGAVAVIRGLYRGCVWNAQAARVVEDREDSTWLALLPGADCRVPEALSSGRRWGVDERWPLAEAGGWALAPWQWKGARSLVLLEPERPYSISHFWHADTDAFLGWYVNFQLPFRRFPEGFDTLDLDLDLVVGPDRKWGWKDEAEYDTGIGQGGIEASWAEAVEAARPEVLARVANADSPFDGSWRDWTPDPTWEAPALPPGWDQVS